MTAPRNQPPKDQRTRYLTTHRLCPDHIAAAIRAALLEFADEIDIEWTNQNMTVLSHGKVGR